jgi:hypothetical protein
VDKFIYIIGSLRNDRAAVVANELRSEGFNIFDDWHSQGTDADDHWARYEKRRGRNYREALEGKAANHAFQFDYNHLLMCSAAVMVMPAGKSAHLELGWVLGKSKPGFILLDGEPDRFELMVKFATAICYDVEELVAEMKKRGL